MLLREKALRGDARSLDSLLEFAVRFNNEAVDVGPAQPLPTDDRAILAAYVAATAPANDSSKAEGDPIQDLVPKPRKRKAPNE